MVARLDLARIFHESLAATTDMAVLPGVLGCRTLRRTVEVRLGTETLRLPGGTPIFVASRQQFMKYPGLREVSAKRLCLIAYPPTLGKMVRCYSLVLYLTHTSPSDVKTDSFGLKLDSRQAFQNILQIMV